MVKITIEGDGEGRIFKCREYDRVSHYQAKCLTFFKKQKKNFHATLSYEDTNDNEEDDGATNAFIVNFTKTGSVTKDESENFEEDSDNQLSLEMLKIMWKENSEVRAIQKEKIQEENERLLSILSSLKVKLKKIQTEYDQTMKSVKMLNSRSENLDIILSLGQSSSNRYDLGFDSSLNNTGQTTKIKFVPATVNIKVELPVETKVVSSS